MQTNTVPQSRLKRIFSWTWRQKSKTPICPTTPLLQNKIVVMTGGTKGIGLETLKGLIQREAEVIILSRDKEAGEKLVNQFKGKVHFIELDLADMKSLSLAVNTLKTVLSGRKIDILINNAGIALREPYRETEQGYELTFAVNTLGHHILFKECHVRNLLCKNAQIIALTGDIYTLAKGCSAYYKYEGNSGVQAYCRSKLGVMWWAYECSRLYKEYKINIVHPGVVPLGLGANEKSFFTRILSSLLLCPKTGAQMTLICATQENINSGEYYHNTLGRAILPKNDIALNRKLSRNFWGELEEIYNHNF